MPESTRIFVGSGQAAGTEVHRGLQGGLLGSREKNVQDSRNNLSMALSLLLVAGTMPSEVQAQQTVSTGYSGQGAPLYANELQQLVAPIALYPDALVAQILGASTFPDQVAYADDWLHQNQNLSGKTLMQAVDAQPWDPSVKALTQFSSVLDNLAKNLSWTSALGEAYHTQTADVMSAIQALRAKAQAAGNLKSSSQIVVVQQAPQTIVIQSANPQVVYVPVYNPTVVYGTPYVTPGYSTAAVVTTGVIAFGAGIAVGAMMSGGCCGWGYSSWNGIGTALQSCITAGRTTGTMPGTAATTVPAALRMVPTVPHTIATAITRPLGLTHEVPRPRTPTGAKASVKPTTQEQVRTVPPSKVPMLMGAGAVPPLRKMAPLLTASTKRTLTEPLGRCTARAVPRLMARQASTATAPPLAKPQMATSTPRQTAKPTAIPAAAGARRAEARTLPVTTNPVPAAGEGRRRAADHRPGVEVTAEVGATGRQVLAVGQAGVAVVVAGAAVVAVGETQRCSRK